MFTGKLTDLDLLAVKSYLRIDHEEDDALIQALLLSSKSYIETYLKRKLTDFDEIPDEFTIASLAIIAHWYERREIQANKDDRGEISHAFTAIIAPHRNWS